MRGRQQGQGKSALWAVKCCVNIIKAEQSIETLALQSQRGMGSQSLEELLGHNV